MDKQTNNHSAKRIQRLGSILFSVGAIAAVLTIPAAYAGEISVWIALTLAMVEGIMIGAGVVIRD